MQDAGFRVQGSVSVFSVASKSSRTSSVTCFRLQGSGCRVQGAGFKVQGAGFTVHGSGFRIQGSSRITSRIAHQSRRERARSPAPGFRVQGARCRVQGADGFRVRVEVGREAGREGEMEGVR